MAIDNLHYRCSENSHKLKYEFDEKNLNTDNKKDTKPVKKSEDGPKAEEEVTYEQRSKQAASKLKSILSHMKDFKAIID